MIVSSNKQNWGFCKLKVLIFHFPIINHAIIHNIQILQDDSHQIFNFHSIMHILIRNMIFLIFYLVLYILITYPNFLIGEMNMKWLLTMQIIHEGHYFFVPVFQKCKTLYARFHSHFVSQHLRLLHYICTNSI